MENSSSLSLENTNDDSINSKYISIPAHSRPINRLKFNHDGDLLFSCSKDKYCSMFNSETGELLGSFDNHMGSVTSILPLDFNLISCSTDLTIKNSDITNGKCLYEIQSPSIVKDITSYDNSVFYVCTDNAMNYQALIGRIDSRFLLSSHRNSGELESIYNSDIAYTNLFHKDNELIVSDVKGNITKFDLRTNQILMQKTPHYKTITSINPSPCYGFFSTSSSDATFMIIDTDTFTVKKKFESEEPVNCAVIHPENGIIGAVGGINARDVTTTKGKSHFDTNFYDIVTMEKIGAFSTHAGTINTIDMSKDGKRCATGAEDGQISLIRFGSDFLNAPFSDLS